MDHLWPLILSRNKCDTNKTNTAGYFIPQQKFDHIWAHELLARKNVDNYFKPIELSCKQTFQHQTPVFKEEEEEIEQLPYHGPDAKILPLDQQLAIIQQNVEVRKNLAKDFANRQYPWYIQPPLYLQSFEITKEIRLQFKDSFEYEILENLQRFKCHLMLIDVASAISLRSLERWLKFSPYAALVVVIRDKELFRKISNFNHAFNAVLMEENLEITWQEELNNALDVAVEKAKELFFFENFGQPFVFVFSNKRGICVWNNFKILRKF